MWIPDKLLYPLLVASRGFVTDRWSLRMTGILHTEKPRKPSVRHVVQMPLSGRSSGPGLRWVISGSVLSRLGFGLEAVWSGQGYDRPQSIKACARDEQKVTYCRNSHYYQLADLNGRILANRPTCQRRSRVRPFLRRSSGPILFHFKNRLHQALLIYLTISLSVSLSSRPLAVPIAQ
ncbi:hypothetical protein BCR39DRAFT_75447 [Naematelia encephala]|uniref:Uncharacterized protein n=1 Tax=Naematelia encephala TaxID=71784 RepID=A0A1Y2AEE0_9TREE|nr:hypothetical protein BCR39DRAFT_75447 [Naematelia encephala]